MGLRTTVQRQVLSAFKAIGDLAQPATYASVAAEPVIDVVAGTSTQSRTTYALKRCVFARIRQEEVDHDVVQLDDMKVLFPKTDLPIEPDTSDVIIDAGGREWQIMQTMGDPAGALVILRVRAA